MTNSARKPQKIDAVESQLWGLASYGSAGIGPAGVQLFDLVNRETHRAHRLELKTVGVGISPPFTGSFGASDYVNFTTPFMANFQKFDGLHMTVRETNAVVYSWTTVSFWGMSVKIADGGLNIPGLAVSSGTAKILYGNGRALGSPDLELKLPPVPPEPQPFRNHAKNDALVYRIPGDLLFEFAEHVLKMGVRTTDLLTSVGSSLHFTPEFRFLVVGHTDSVGGVDYNIKLSKRRAETVATWLKKHNYLRPEWVKTVGMGKSEPLESNSTSAGRTANRRVEVVGLRTHLWESYKDP